VDDEILTPAEMIQREMASRVLCRRHLLPFVLRFKPVYDPGWVHKDICTRLEKFSDDVAAKKSPRLMLFMPPRHGKSELVSRNFPAWHMGRHPEHEVITTSYSSSLALKFSRSVRTLLREPGYAELFPNCALDPDTQAAEAWMTTKGGGLMAAGVSGPLTGNGMHIGIIDDPVKNREEAESSTIREGIKEWYTSTFYTRLAPGGGILVVMTRWHHDDLAGWLLEEAKHGGDEWEVVVYPAEAEVDEVYRKKGEALHESRYPVETLQKIKAAIGPRDYTALYLQRPTAEEGAFFKREWINYYDPFELPDMSELTIYSAWDLAIGKDAGNDETVGITVGIDRNQHIWVLDIAHGRWDAHEICVQILDSWRRWKPIRVGIERGHIFMTMGPLLERLIAERKDWEFPFDQDGLRPGRADKQARAAPIQGRMRQGYVHVPRHASWLSHFIQQLLEFPNAVHDDYVDAFAWIGQMINQFITVPVPRPVRAPSWKDRLNEYMVKQNMDTSHMGA
jgi:predicted phage terminase large subunit-like protein